MAAGEEVPLLELKNVSKAYPGVVPVHVLRGASLRVARGESVAIVGPSGSGKSTILNLLGTLDHPDSGVVSLDGRDLTRLDPAELARVRNQRIGFIFQSHHLLPQCSALENVLLPTLATARSTAGEAESRAARLLERVGLQGRLNHLPGQLSGGERQRTAVVRALINQPALVLADEPTGALDRTSAESLAQLLVELNREEGVTLIVVTHSAELARQMGRTVELCDGQLLPVMNADPQLAGYYARRAPEYDRIYSRPERQSDLRWLQSELSRLAAGRRVLEVACGTGWWTRILADAAASVMALDVNPEVLEVARGRLAVSRNSGTVSSLAPVQLLCRDLYSEEPLPGPYDCGFAGFWWSHVPRLSLPQFLTGFHRHLEPDAVVVFLDNCFVPGNSTPLSRTDADGNTYQVRRLYNGSECEVLKNFPDPAELEATVAAVGRDVRITTREYYWLMTYRVGPGGGHCS